MRRSYENNLYAFCFGNPISLVDVDGQGVNDPPPNPIPLPKPTPIFPFPKNYNCSCCGPDEVAKGKSDLISRFNKAKDYLDGKHLVINANQDSAGQASCAEVNGTILNFIEPTPRCWACFEDNREDRYHFGHTTWDENFIHCETLNSLPQTGRPSDPGNEIIFDYFQYREQVGAGDQGATGVWSGVDLNNFYNMHPNTGTPLPNQTLRSIDCSQPSSPWVEMDRILDGLF
jgi:hypothetical protein